MRVLVIGGGISGERKISLKSAKAVQEAALAAGHEAVFYDWDGNWDWLDKNLQDFDLALPILHGVGGEDGQIQEYLETKHIKYLGSGPKASRLCFDKEKTRQVLAKNGVLVSRGGLVDFSQYRASPLSKLPHVLKPVDGGSSLETLIYRSPKNIDPSAAVNLFDKHKTMLLEEYINGTEATMPILEGKDLPVIEIIPPEGETFDYENKYNGKTDELCPPRNINPQRQKRLQALGRKVHDYLGCKHISRVDVIISGEKDYILEANTIPGLTNASLFPKSAQVIGIDMPELVDYLIKLASK